MTRIIEMELTELEIPKDMFKKVPKMASAHLYMLSKETMAITFDKSPEFAQKSIWNDKIIIKETDKSLIFVLPQIVTSFYHIIPTNVSVSVSQKTDTIHVDIE